MTAAPVVVGVDGPSESKAALVLMAVADRVGARTSSSARAGATSPSAI